MKRMLPNSPHFSVGFPPPLWKRAGKALIILLLILAVVFLSYPWLLNAMANHLIVRDRLEKADVILVLAGDSNGERVAEGVKLYKEGFSPYWLLSGGPLAWNLTSAEQMKKQALAMGVPERKIILQERSRSTIDDANYCLPIIKKYNFRSIILVTSPYHSRRAGKVFNKLYKPLGIKIIIRPAEKSEFNPDQWWQRHEDSAAVVWEYTAMVLYFFKGF